MRRAYSGDCPKQTNWNSGPGLVLFNPRVTEEELDALDKAFIESPWSPPLRADDTMAFKCLLTNPT